MRLDEVKTSLYEGLTSKDITFVKLWEDAGRIILEADLTSQQINQLFQQVEQDSDSAGSNRSMLGKGKDVAQAVNKAWEELKTKVQDSGPVKEIDAMYDKAAEKLKQATGGDDGVMKYVQKYRDFAKKHPVAQSLIYSALIAAAGISGAGVGGAAALGLFKLVDKLLQGEKFSSAAYSGAKTGALAYGAGQLGKMFKHGDTQQPNTSAASTASDTAGSMRAGDIVKQAMPILKQKMANGEITDPKSFNDAVQMVVSDVAGKASTEAYQEKAVELLSNSYDKLASANESIKYIKIPLSESKIYMLFGTIQSMYLTEGVLDSLKGVAQKTGNAISQKAQTVGHNLTTKVTADKLKSAWQRAGSPKDANEIVNILRKAGVDNTVVASAMKKIGVMPPQNQQQPATQQSAQQSAQQPAQQPATGKAAAPGKAAKTTPAAAQQSGTTPKPAAAKAPAAKPAPGTSGTELTKGWIQYLKSSQIVALQSDPKTGKLNYSRPVTTDDLTKYLQSTGKFEDDAIQKAIAAATKPEPVKKGAKAAAPQQPATPPQQQSQQQPAQPAQQKPRYKMGPDGKPVQISEDIVDTPAATIDEKQVEKVFALLGAPKAAPAAKQPKPMDDETKLSELKKLKRTIRDVMTPGQRKALWRALNEV